MKTRKSRRKAVPKGTGKADKAKKTTSSKKPSLESLRLSKKDTSRMRAYATDFENPPVPETVRRAPWVHKPVHPAHDGSLTTLRRTSHNGREIEVKTTYEISVDGRRLADHVSVAKDGSPYSHSCPYEQFSSMVDLVKRLVDLYPESFAGVKK